MRRFFYWCIALLLLTGCIPSGRQVPAATTGNLGNLQGQALTTITKTSEITPSITASHASAFPWLNQQSVFFQPGDLPVGVYVNLFDQSIPDYLQAKYELPPEGAARISYSETTSGQDYGNVILLAYQQAASLESISQILIQTEDTRRQGVPLDGIGDYAFIFMPEAPGRDTALFFKTCHSFVQIRLLNITDPEIIKRYAGRLFERLQQIDCFGNLVIPVLSPPPPLPTLTPNSVVSFGTGFIPIIQRLPDPDGTILIRAFAFPDVQHGWIALGAKILSSTDGGETWHVQTITDSPVKQIVFYSALEGWIETQNEFLITKNGGVNWQATSSRPSGAPSRMPPPPSTIDISGMARYSFCPEQAPYAGLFTSTEKHTGWAICTSSPGDHYSYVKLYQTLDGGQHWELINDSPPYGAWGSSSLVFLDNMHGWIANNYIGVYSTDDGGKTWQALDNSSLDSGWITDMQFLTVDTGFAILKGSTWNQGRDVLVKTQDGGLTWQNVFDAPAPLPWPDGPFQVFTDGKGIGSTANLILSTRDAGRSWSQPIGTLRPSGCKFAVQITGLAFPDIEHGWAIVTCAAIPLPVLFSTSDGGRTWQESPVGLDNASGLVGISFPDIQNGYLVTQAGDLYRTTDGGKTFKPVDNLSIHTSSIHFVTPQWGGENRGTMLYQTHDGGQSWQIIPFNLPVQYFSLLPDGQAWIVAGEVLSDSGTPVRRFFSSTDGGQTWEEHVFGEIPVNYDYPWLDGIRFADSLHGWLRAGTQLFYTADGGKSWVQYH